MTTSRCRRVDNDREALSRALAESRSSDIGWLVLFLQGIGNGRRWLLELDEGPIKIGRSDEADLALEDATVSGCHACVERHGGDLFIKDMRSTNGTFVNEKRIFSQPLVNGDILRCGGDRLRVVLEGLPEP